MNRPRFTPDGRQAALIDLRMRQLLGDSLRHIIEQVNGTIDCDQTMMGRVADGLREGRLFPPSTFALYADLVIAIEGGNHAKAAAIMKELGHEIPLSESRQIVEFGAPRNAARDQLYHRYMDTDPTVPLTFLQPSDEAAGAFRERLDGAFGLISKAMPELADEFDRLVRQIILVAPEPDSKYQFDGGSSYMLWGGLFLNVLSHENEIALVEVLAHESAHLLLFGFACDESLVLNPDDELYASPLRLDPRPMDGIFHSTYVSARMHWAMSRLLDSGLLDEQQAAIARSARDSDRENFDSGYQVIAESAVLTVTGRAAIQSAREYMRSV